MASTKVTKRVKQVVKVHGRPEDHSHKTYLSGQKLGEQGSVLSGHRLALKHLRERHVPVNLHH